MQKLASLLNTIKIALKMSWQRYPEALSFAYLFGILAIVRVHKNIEFIFNVPYENVMIAIMTTVPLALASVALYERKKLTAKFRYAITGISAAFALLLCLTLPEQVESVDIFRIFVLNVSLYLAFTLIPFWYNDENYDIGVIQLLSRTAITLLYSVVLILGSFAILTAIDYLLGILIEGELYSDIAIAVFTFFAPTFLLGDVPDRYTVKYLMLDTLIKKLHVYVIMPLLLIYSAVLYLYFAKIVFSMTLPRNMIVHLTLWYSLIAILTLFFVNSYRREFGLSTWFYKWMPRILILPIGMMLFSLYLRVSQYGVTVKRYFVVALALWVVAVVIYFIIRQKRVYQNIVVAAIVVMLISMYGPLNAFNVSFNSQYGRFVNLLEQKAMLKGDKIVINNSISRADKKEIIDFIRFFDRQNQLDRLAFLPADFDPIDDTEVVFGFTYQYSYYIDSDRVSYYAQDDFTSEDITLYNKFQKIRIPDYSDNHAKNSWNFDDANNLIIIGEDGERIEIPLLETLDSLKGKERETGDKRISIIGDNPKYLFLITEISGQYVPKDSRYRIDYLSGYLFTE